MLLLAAPKSDLRGNVPDRHAEFGFRLLCAAILKKALGGLAHRRIRRAQELVRIDDDVEPQTRKILLRR